MLRISFVTGNFERPGNRMEGRNKEGMGGGMRGSGRSGGSNYRSLDGARECMLKQTPHKISGLRTVAFLAGIVNKVTSDCCLKCTVAARNLRF